MPDPDLDSIGLAQRTDKSSLCHDFLQLYDRILGSLRHEPVTFLEIGIYDGGSVRMWEEYFPRGKIVGVDIDPRTLVNRSERTDIEIVDQSNVDQLHGLAQRHGPFDVVLDDGSHIWDHQITSLRSLFPYVKPGGYYIVEDLDTSYGTHQPVYRGRASASAASYLQRLADAMVGDAVIDLGAEPDDFIRSYARTLDYVLFSRRTSVIRRKPEPA